MSNNNKKYTTVTLGDIPFRLWIPLEKTHLPWKSYESFKAILEQCPSAEIKAAYAEGAKPQLVIGTAKKDDVDSGFTFALALPGATRYYLNKDKEGGGYTWGGSVTPTAATSDGSAELKDYLGKSFAMVFAQLDHISEAVGLKRKTEGGGEPEAKKPKVDQMGSS